MIGTSPFHDGELATQDRAGVGAEAARLAPMLAPTQLGGAMSRFLAERTLAMITARDDSGALWISPLSGLPGFLEGREAALRVHAAPAAGDPLARLPVGQPVGLLVIDLAIRRRIRINGDLIAVDGDGFTVSVEQAYGNCPKYIWPRHLGADTAVAVAEAPAIVRRSHVLDSDQTRLITGADTFFLGTTHPDRGPDASHRGGAQGFVRVAGADLWWPDYPGNNLFNSFGNLAVDATAALVFLDFATGGTLHLSGAAAVEWIEPGTAGDDGGTGRRVRFTPAHIVGGRQPAMRARAAAASGREALAD